MATYTGTSGADEMYLGASNDKMSGKGGNDTLGGGAGRDTIDGGDGNDLLYGGGDDGAADVLKGGDGNDYLAGWFGDNMDGGAGRDWAQFDIAASAADIVMDLTVLGNVTGSVGGVAQAAGKYSGVEVLVVATGSGADLITVGAIGTQVSTFDGDDTVWGGTAGDYIRGMVGDDRLDGGGGYDRVGYDGSLVGVTVSLAKQGSAQNTVGAGKDFLTGFEAVSGTAFNDKLTGDANGNWLWGQDGNDTLIGGGGNDLLSVGNGNHLLYGDDGRDIVNFYGNGAFATGAVCNLNLKAAQDTGHGMMTLRSIERLSGSLKNDVFTGDKFDNDIAGDAGSDLLTGGAGNDFIAGDSAFDVDPYNISGPPQFIPFRPNAADPNNSFRDTIDGGVGDDTIVGGVFLDTLTGGKGADTFIVGGIYDSPDYAPDTITDLKDSEDIIDLSRLDADVGAAGDQAFVLVAEFSGTAGEAVLIYDSVAKVTSLQLDDDGDGLADTIVNLLGRHDAFENFIL